MLDYLDDFVDGDVKETLVGGIAGTEINKFAIEAATKHHDFKKVLVIEGCQDYIGILKNPIDNVNTGQISVLKRSWNHSYLLIYGNQRLNNLTQYQVTGINLILN
jgi:hypothetical protein